MKRMIIKSAVHKVRIIVTVIFILFFTACLSVSIKPSWVDGKSDRYSDQEYLLATGSADKEEDAKSRALANLARIFEVQIDDTSIDRTQVDIQQTAESQQVSQAQTVIRYVDAYTYKQLEGAEIVELWLDKKTSQRYALAAISRKKLSASLRQSILEVDNVINSYMRASKSAKDPIASLNHIYKAVQANWDRSKFVKDLQIVFVDSNIHKFQWPIEHLNAERESVLRSVKISPQIAGDPLNILKPILQSGAAVAGFTISETKYDYILQGALDIEDLGMLEGWYWYRGALEIELIDDKSGQVRGQKRWPVKVSGRSKEQAKVRLKSTILSLLNKQLGHAIANFD